MTQFPKAIFLSYAHEDVAVARRVAEALRGFGMEVWFDENELRGGDAWDAKLRQQIHACNLFLPIISAQTQERAEGYFRREWKLAINRMDDLAEGIAFLLPVVIDDTQEYGAAVPESFTHVQWIRLANGEPTPDFVAQVKRLLDAPRHPVPTATSIGRHVAGDPTPGTAGPVTKQRSGIRGWMIGAVAVVLLAAGVVYWTNRDVVPIETAAGARPETMAEKQQTAEVAAPEKSIAVLPLTNMSPDPDNAFFADGVQEDIITNLSRIEELRVIARTSTQQYRETVKTTKEIGTELGVSYLVEGSVRRAGNRVQVTVQIIDVQADDHICAENYNRDLDDIFAVQASIAKDIAGQLEAAISPEEIKLIERRPTKNQEAYDYFIKERQLIETGVAKWEEKVALLEKAVALDPDFAEAWAQLSVEYIFSWAFPKRRNDPELLAKAHQAISEARRLKPNLAYIPYAQNFLAGLERGDIEAQLNHLLEALAMDPGFRHARFILGLKCQSLGRLAEAQFHLEKAIGTDPLSQRTNFVLSYTYVLRGLWDEARALSEVNFERTDGDDNWRWLLAYMEYLQTGDKKAYFAALNAIPSISEGGPFFGAALQDLEESNPVGSSIQDFSIAQVPGSPPEWFFRIDHLNLLSALMWFELGEKGKWLTEEEKAKTYLEEIVEVDPLADPSYLSNLTICHALEGERDLMDSTITKVRGLTNSVIWKYRRQARCEMHIAIAYIVLGDNDTAIETLIKASEMESIIFLNRELGLWSIFDRLRGDPRFDKLLED